MVVAGSLDDRELTRPVKQLMEDFGGWVRLPDLEAGEPKEEFSQWLAQMLLTASDPIFQLEQGL